MLKNYFFLLLTIHFLCVFGGSNNSKNSNKPKIASSTNDNSFTDQPVEQPIAAVSTVDNHRTTLPYRTLVHIFKHLHFDECNSLRAQLVHERVIDVIPLQENKAIVIVRKPS